MAQAAASFVPIQCSELVPEGPGIAARASLPPSDTATRPARRQPFVDASTRTCLDRVTDVSSDPVKVYGRNDYSRRQAFNADSSLQLVAAADGYWHLYRTKGNQHFARLSGPAGDAEPQWHPSNPDLLYYLPNNGVGMKLFELNVRSGISRTVADFAGRLRSRWPAAATASTRSEGSPSADGRYWCFMVDSANWASQGVFTYDVQQDEILGYLDTQGARPDHVSMSPSGKFCVVSGDGAIGTTAFSRDFSSRTKLHHKSEHSDLAIGANGDDMYVAIDYQSRQGDVFMVNLSTGERTALFPTYVGRTSTALHVSGKAYAFPGWVVISTYGEQGPATQWFHRRVMAVRLAARAEPILLANTRVQYKGYATAPVASVNRDFTMVTFNSNWNQANDREIDVFRVEVPRGFLGR